jgi:Flp pilus assembly protein TadB
VTKLPSVVDGNVPVAGGVHQPDVHQGSCGQPRLQQDKQPCKEQQRRQPLPNRPLTALPLLPLLLLLVVLVVLLLLLVLMVLVVLVVATVSTL